MPTVQQLLTFEAAHPRPCGVKHERIRNELGIAPAVYYRNLLRAAESLEGQQHDPFTARRVVMRVRLARDRRAHWMTFNR